MTATENAQDTVTLVEGLKTANAYPHPTTDIVVIETHISYVFLTGEFAYKIKKPVRLPFVDFSSLERRRYFCERELELNRRLAREMYLEVTPVGGSFDKPKVGESPPIEYAVKMRQFDADRTADALLADGALTATALVSMARRLAAFHASLDAASGPAPTASTKRNLAELATEVESGTSYGKDRYARAALHRVERWVTTEADALEPFFAVRNERGFVRDCHGDLHLRNIAWIDGELVPFDCLEFDDDLRKIDLIDEIAFLAMDLMAHGRDDLACIFVDAYLRITGDYDGLRLLRYYSVHRALVRAKVRQLAHDWGDEDERRQWPFLSLADRLTRAGTPLLIITMGLSGSGKTSVTDQLIGPLAAIRVRSDIERKRLRGLDAAESSHSGVGQGLYDAQTTTAAYDWLLKAAQAALEGGVNIIVDATFIDRQRRRDFCELAKAQSARFLILNCTAPVSVLRERIKRRRQSLTDASEADLAVLDHQLDRLDALAPNERGLEVDTTLDLDPLALTAQIQAAAR